MLLLNKSQLVYVSWRSSNLRAELVHVIFVQFKLDISLFSTVNIT